jgi:hypothetical protein
VGRAKKNDWRDILDVIDLIRPTPTYELVVMLKLSEARIRTRLGYFDLVSQSYAASTGTLPRELFDAVTDTDEEAATMDYEVNSARRVNELRASHG